MPEYFNLFKDGWLSQKIEDLRQSISNKIHYEETDYILNVNEDDYVTHIFQQFHIDPLIIDRTKLELINSGEIEEYIDGDMGKIKVRRNFYTFSVPFQGNNELFCYTPNQYSHHHPLAKIFQNELIFKFIDRENNPDKIKRNLNSILDIVENYIKSSSEQIEVWNKNLRNQIEEYLKQRKEKLLQDIGKVNSFGVPVRKRKDLPESYIIPIKKKKIVISKPTASNEPYEPYPTLEQDTYEEILNTLYNMVLVIERNPTAFHNMGEEDLRTHFLVHLNGVFEGQATGETFNFNGKTDILIRHEEKNLFIAECKFWKGPKEFIKTIDQLLNYLTWRDSKIAILLFVRDTEMSTVIKKIPEIIQLHENFISLVNSERQGEFCAKMKSTKDINISLLMTVQCYHIPKN